MSLAVIHGKEQALRFFSYNYFCSCIDILAESIKENGEYPPLYDHITHDREKYNIQIHQSGHIWDITVVGLNDKGLVTGNVIFYRASDGLCGCVSEGVPLVLLIADFKSCCRWTSHGLLPLLEDTNLRQVRTMSQAIRDWDFMHRQILSGDASDLWWSGDYTVACAWRDLMPCISYIVADRMLKVLFTKVSNSSGSITQEEWGHFQELLGTLAEKGEIYPL